MTLTRANGRPCFNLFRSGDATARIWQIPTNGEEALPEPIVLKHLPALTDINRDVTTMDWNVRPLRSSGCLEAQRVAGCLIVDLMLRPPLFRVFYNSHQEHS